MIYIKKNAINPILLQLTQTNVSGEYYFKFINIMTNTITYFVSDNYSNSIATWDLFQLEEDSNLTPNPEFESNSAICLLSGQYQYTVISAAQLPVTIEEAIDNDIKDNYITIGKMVVEILDNTIDTIDAISYYDMKI